MASVVLLSSAYGFGSTDAKTSDHFFTGFPSYWNIVALYLYVARAAARVNAMILLVLSALVFVRIGYVYPSRTPVLRTCDGGRWRRRGARCSLVDHPGAAGAPHRSRWLVSLAFPVYYIVLSLVLQLRRAPVAIAKAPPA